MLNEFNRVCDRTARIKKDYLIERFDTPSNHIVTLEDNTFLLFLSQHLDPYGYEGKYVVRFDKEMNTKSDIFKRGEYYLFEMYEFIEWEKKNGVDYGSLPSTYSAQTTIDNIMEYIKTLK